MNDTEQALTDAVALAPDPVPPSLALAKWLKESDDPASRARGELIELQSKIERGEGSGAEERRAHASIRKHGDEWTGGLVSRLKLEVRFRLGFVEAFTVPDDARALQQDAYETFVSLFGHPSFRFVRQAHVGVFGEPVEERDQSGVYAFYKLSDFFSAIDGAFDHAHPAPLRTITLGLPAQLPRWRPKCSAGRSKGFSFATASASTTDVAWLLRDLRALRLRCQLDDPSAFDVLAAQLVEYEYRPSEFYHPHGSPALRDIAGVSWPHLESLTVGRTWFEDWDGGKATWGRASGCSVGELSPVLDGEATPRLRHLTLSETDFADELCETIPRSRIAGRLETLSLARGPITRRGAEALIAAAGAFDRLTRLDVDGCGLDASDLARLRDAFPSALGGPAKATT